VSIRGRSEVRNTFPALSVVAALLLGVALASGSLGDVTGAAAVQPDEFEVLVPKATLDTPFTQPERPTVKTLGQAIGRLTVRVASQTCPTVDLADPAARNSAGDIVIRVGSPGQPTACSAEGAAVTFVTGAGRELFLQFVFRHGTSQTLANLAPKPPSLGASGSAASTSPIQATPGLRYRLHLFTGFRGPSDGPAQDGTLVQVFRLPDPRVQRPRPSGP
jgi:hypothetical protein